MTRLMRVMCRQSWTRVLFLSIAAAVVDRAAAQMGALSLSSGSGAPGASVTLSLSFQANGTQPAAMQWDFTYSRTDLSPAAGTYFTTGGAASAAGKQVSCNAVSPGDVRCLAAGLNATAITNGVIATITFQIKSTTDTSSPVSVTNVTGSDGLGNNVAIGGAGGTVTINPSAAPVLSSLTCTPASLASPGTTFVCSQLVGQSN